MSVRTNWFLDDMPGLDDSDPFAAVEAPPRVEDVGIPFDLRDIARPLHNAAVELLREEAQLHEQGITCAVKNRSDSSCSACMVSHDDEPNHPMHRLCAIGREQERVLTQQAHEFEDKRGA